MIQKRQMKTHLSHKAGATGFEPVSTVLETAALPLNYTPMSSDLFIIPRIVPFVNKKIRDFYKFLEQKGQFLLTRKSWEGWEKKIAFSDRVWYSDTNETDVKWEM